MAIEREVKSPFESKRHGGFESKRHGGFMHMSMTKAFLIRAIREHGAKLLLGPAWTGTDEEAVATVEADGREYFVPDSCDNQAPNGECAGHKNGR